MTPLEPVENIGRRVETCADCRREFVWSDDGSHSMCAVCQTGSVCVDCIPAHACFQPKDLTRCVDCSESLPFGPRWPNGGARDAGYLCDECGPRWKR